MMNRIYISQLIISPEAEAALSQPTGVHRFISLLGLVGLFILLLVVLFCVYKIYIFLKEKKSINHRENIFRIIGIIMYFILSFFFIFDFTRLYDSRPKLYGIPLLWISVFFMIAFRKTNKRKLFYAVSILLILTAPFLIYVMLPPDVVDWQFLNNIQINIPFFKEECMGLVSVSSQDYGCFCHAFNSSFKVSVF